MIAWFKRFFGLQELTLAEKHAEASRIGQSALGFMHNLADDLQEANETLLEVAQQAEAEANDLLARKTAAVAEAVQHRSAADKIRALVS